MATPSFSHLLANLFLGLCRGSVRLRPVSTEFKRELGYQVFGFEESFPMSTGRTLAPDLVLISRRVQTSLIIEWTTAGSVGEDKESQLRRCYELQRTDLTDVLGIPPGDCRQYDVVIIVKPESVVPFKTSLETNQWGFPILAFGSREGEHFLGKKANRFADPVTDRFFQQGISVREIPLSYLPFPLDQILRENLAPHVVRHLVALVVKGIESVTLEKFCSGYVGPWKVIGTKKQKEISRATKGILSALCRTAIGAQLLERSGRESLWRLIAEPRVWRRPDSLARALDPFVRQMRGENYQQELPL